MSTVAPVVLFTYNRPDHTQKTIEALKKNREASQTILYIFSDAAKDAFDQEAVSKVRKYADTITGFKEVHVYKRAKNLGLSENVIHGVSEIISEHKKVIVLEDDLITDVYFLEYMNHMLETYADTDSVFAVSGYAYPISLPSDYEHDVYLASRSSSWGWATWQDRWESIDWAMKNYESFIQNKALTKAFDTSGNLTKMLTDQHNGKINSWAIRRTFSQFLQKKYTLFPRTSYVKNIGLDGSGVHKAHSLTEQQETHGIPPSTLRLPDSIERPAPGIDNRIKKATHTPYVQRVLKKIFSNI